MAFFDDLSKKISQGGQDVIRKTNEMAALARINSRIAAEEKELLLKYQQIGQRFYADAAKFGPDTENISPALFQELLTLCQSVSDTLRSIEAGKEEIITIRNIKRCGNCGAECAAHAPFCAACGNALPIPEPPAPAAGRVCPGCGKALLADAVFCTGCGLQVPIAPAPAPAPAPEPAGKLCPGCSKVLPVDAQFCTGCGTRME